MSLGDRQRPSGSTSLHAQGGSGMFDAGTGLALAERPDPPSELQLYREFLGGLDDGFCILKMRDGSEAPIDARILETNEAFSRQTGLNGSTGKWLGEVAPDVAAAWLGPLARVARTGAAEHVDLRAVSDTSFDVFAMPVGPSEDNLVAALLVDRTKTQAAEEELGRAMQVLNAHLQNSPLAVIEFDPDFRVIGWSDEAERLFGYRADEILGCAIADLKWVYEEDAQLVADESTGFVDGTRTRSKNVNRNYRKDGSVVWCEWYSSAIHDEEGHLQSVLSLVLDVTERRRAEEDELAAKEQARRELETTSLLLEASTTLADWTSLTEVSAALADLLLRTTCHTRATVGDFDERSNEIRVIASAGDSPARVGDRWPLETASTGLKSTLEQRKPAVHDFGSVSEADRGTIVDTYRLRKGFYVPLVRAERVVGIIVVDDPGEARDFTERDKTLIEGIASHAVVAIQNARLLEREREAARFGDILASIDRSVHSSLQVEEIVASALAQGAAAIGADSAAVNGIEDGGWVVWYAWGFSDPVVGTHFTDQQNVHGAAAVRAGVPIAIDDAFNDHRVDTEMMRYYGLRSVIVAPLIVRGRPIAALYYNYRSDIHRFTPQETDFVAKVASSLSLAIENARHYETEHRISETLQETLVVLPKHVHGIAFSRAYESATYEAGRVGGDFVDVYELQKNLVAIALGDVSGKGVDAAVTTSLVRTTLRVHAIDGLPPAALAAKTNEVVRAFTETESFITVWFGLLNTKTGQLRYVCAGHPPAIVLSRSGEVRELECRDPILGAFDDARYYECQTVLTRGDRLILYSDGLTEARAPEGDFLDYPGLHSILLRRADRPTTELANDIMDEVVEFSDGVLRDDAALLVVEPVRLAAVAADSAQLRVQFCDDEPGTTG